jgi:hypothetical protein
MTDQERLDIQRPDIAQTLQAGTAATNVLGRDLDKKADRSTVWIAATVAALISSAVSIAIAVPGAIQGAKQAAVADTIASQQAENRERADAAYETAVAANEELKRRGQPQVAVPEPDGRGDDLDTFIPAAVAGVLAALPEHVRQPTADEIASTVIAYMRANPVPGVTPQQVAEATGQWLRENPPPPGPAGQDGQDGQDGVDGKNGADAPPPTDEQVRAAVDGILAENPDILCAATGGSWQLLDNVVRDSTPNDFVEQDATTITIWACVPAEGEEPE